MISSSKKKDLNSEFEKLAEVLDRSQMTKQRHVDQRERLRDKHRREKEALKQTQARQFDQAQIKDIRAESLDDVFETTLKQQPGRSSIAPRSNYQLEDDDPCWDNYKQIGTKKKNGKTVPNCVPKEDTGTIKHHQYQKTLKHAMQHATTHKDLDVDGDVDNLEKMVPDEITGTEPNTKTLQKLLHKKAEKEKQHTRKGVAFEHTTLDESFGTFMTAQDHGIRMQGAFEYHPSVQEEGGAGEEGSDKLAKKYKKDTPGQDSNQ